MGELIVFKVNRQGFLDPFSATDLKTVQVVPAVLVKGIFQQGGSQNEIHLALGQAGSELVDHVLGDDVSLGNIQAVDTGKSERGDTSAAGQQQSRNHSKNKC